MLCFASQSASAYEETITHEIRFNISGNVNDSVATTNDDDGGNGNGYIYPPDFEIKTVDKTTSDGDGDSVVLEESYNSVQEPEHWSNDTTANQSQNVPSEPENSNYWWFIALIIALIIGAIALVIKSKGE